MTDELTDEEKKMVASMIGDKFKEELVKLMEGFKQREKTNEARYQLTQKKLDDIEQICKEIRRSVVSNV